MNYIITKEATFTSSIDNVWKAISIGEEISKWFLLANFKAEKGFKYTFKAPDGSCPPIIGEVLSADPYQLSYTWIEEGKDFVTTVNWELESVGKGTKLTLVHSGISNYTEVDAIKMFESFSGGWENCVNGLSEFLKVD